MNKGLALYQWKQDIKAAEDCCNEALRIDPECEAAVATLAQLYLQQNKIEDAVGMFKRQSDLARSEPELVNALTYQYVRSFFLYTVIMPDKSVAVSGFVCPDPVCAAVPRDGESTQCDRAEHRFCAGLSFSSNRGLK